MLDKDGKPNIWIIPHKTFIKKYVILDNNIYKPSGGIQTFIQINTNIEFYANWGKQQIKENGFLNITNMEDIYGIDENDFYDTYKVLKEETKRKSV